MKKIFFCFSCFILLILFYIFDNSNHEILVNSESKPVVNFNALTMMYETEADSGEYVVSNDTSWPQEGYIFNERLSACENGSTLTWDDENKRVLLQTNTSDKCYVYFDVYEPPKLTDTCTSGANLASCIEEFNFIAGDGAEGLYYHDGVGSYTNADQEAGDNSYRFSGANPNNYVCFGSDEETCPNDNLYRIIGVFGDQVKLIKYDYAGSNLLGTDGAYQSSYFYYWNNSTRNNTWSESNLNTVNLNTNYLNNIGSTWSSKITNHTWQVGGNTEANIIYYPNGTPKNAYRNEITCPAESTTSNAKIGLMYVSDYYYGASPTYWTYPGYTTSSHPDGNGNSGSSYGYGAATDDNWMYFGISNWTLSRRSDGSTYVFVVSLAGSVSSALVRSSGGVRPTFYLNPDITLISGIGTISEPYRIL